MRWGVVGVLLALLAAACGSSGPPEEPVSDSGLYIALGDSLSAGIGASSEVTTAFVPLVHRSLGTEIELLNLADAGDTSEQLLSHGHLDEAVAEIEARNSDIDPDNDVRLVTLEIGGNDLLDLFSDLVLTGKCPNLARALERQVCVDALTGALEGFDDNLERILDGLDATDAGVPVILMTLYNPFSGGLKTLDEVGHLALEGTPGTPFPEGVNDVVRQVAEGRDVILVDLMPLFDGGADDLIARDLIHPNDAGYQVIADAVIGAVDELPGLGELVRGSR
jgi:lysophospholipase L1-like esterase